MSQSGRKTWPCWPDPLAICTLGKPLAVTRSTGGLCGILSGPLASSVVDPDEKSLAGRITEVLESGVKPDTSVLQEFSAGSTAGKFLSLTDE